MSSTRRLARLFQTIASNDWTHAEGVAAEIIADEERKKHHGAAQLLRGSLRPNSRNGGMASAAAGGVGPVALAGALALQKPTVSLKNLVLTKEASNELGLLTKEWRHRARLQSLGIQRRSRLLFYGPPGCGKSATATALGESLGLPTYLVRFDSIIGSYLGQTAAHLRQLFEYAETNPCILLFDEIDALGKKRGNPLDVGELDRIVISLMQELEHSHPRGFVIATSNLPTHLDQALWRRFDLVLNFPQPKSRETLRFVRSVAKASHLRPTSTLLKNAKKAKSFAEAKALVESEARRLALDGL